MSYDYSENILVQESAGHLLQNELGWEVAFAYNTEQLGENGTFGRKSYKEILLTRYFREALLRLNPWITPAQMDEAQRKLEHRLSTSSLLQINEGKYFLIRDGIPVTVKKPGGAICPEWKFWMKLISWSTPKVATQQTSPSRPTSPSGAGPLPWRTATCPAPGKESLRRRRVAPSSIALRPSKPSIGGCVPSSLAI